MKKKWIITTVAFVSMLALAACGKASDEKKSDKTTVTIGVVSGSEQDVWEDVAKRLEKQEIKLEIKKFDDYTMPNQAVSDGDLDMNGFQHLAYMEGYNKDHKADLVNMGYTYVSPMGIYSEKIKDVKDIPDKATIVIPNDETNGGRALRLLAQLNLIKIDESKESPMVSDITENKKKIKITEVDASQTARTMQDVDAAVINTNYALDFGLNPYKDALYTDIEKVADYYKNVIAVRKKNADKAVFKKVVKEYQSAATEALIKKLTDGADVPAWK